MHHLGRLSAWCTAVAVMLAACGPSGRSPATSAPATLAAPASMSRPSTAPTPGPAVMVDVPAYRGNAARDGVMPGPGPVGDATIAWKAELPAPVGTSVVTAGGTAFVALRNGTLVALDLMTGAQRWATSVSESSLSTPDIVGDVIVVGTAVDGLQAVDLATGDKRWSVPSDGAIPGAPAHEGDRIVFASDAGTVEAVHAATGTKVWSISVDDPVNGSVAIADGTVVVSTTGSDTRHGGLVALDLASGARRWQTDVGYIGRVGTPAIAGGRVFASTGLDADGTAVHHIVTLDLATGALDWSFANAIDAPVYTPAISGDRTFIPGEDHTLTCVDTMTGHLVWTYHAESVVEVVPALAGSAVYAASNNASAFAVDRVTGTELWSVPIRGVPYGPTVAGGMLLVGTDLGIVYAIGGTLP